MRQTVKTIYDHIDSIAPFDSAEKWDNSGLLIGNFDTEVDKILLALDVTEEVVDEAVSGAFQLIVTHHPIIFTGIKDITASTRSGRLILKLNEHKISVIAAHTNLDRSFSFGINRYIGDLYGLKNLSVLNRDEGFGVVGIFDEPVNFQAFIRMTKSIFDIEFVKIANANQHINNEACTIHKLAISSGASSDFIKDAIDSDADVFVTSDLKYHEAQSVLSTKLMLADVGHFESEFVFMNRLKDLIEDRLNHSAASVLVKVSQFERPLFKIV